MGSKGMVRDRPLSGMLSLADVHRPGFQSLDKIPWRAGVPRSRTSDLEKFEGLDPA